MGRRGPIAKGAASEKLAGNPSKRKPRAKKGADSAPSIGSGSDAPAWLTPAARIEWHLVEPSLKEPLRPEQLSSFACYCQSVADYQWSVATLEEEGRTVMPPNGIPMEHPAAKIKRDAMQRIRQFGVEFGLTPASRARVPDPPEQPEKDRLGEFLAAK